MDSHEKAKKDILDAASLQFIKARDEKPILGVKKNLVNYQLSLKHFKDVT